MIRDYRIYEFSRKEKMISFLEGMALNGLISWLFYNSVYAMIPGMIIVAGYFREKRRILGRKRMRQMRQDFKEFLTALIAALQTGRSIENAFAEGYRDTAGYLGTETAFLKELRLICTGISVGEPLEKLLYELSGRSHMEELEYFSQVFSIGKRSGGNLVSILKNTVRMLQEKMDAEDEIYTVLAEKQLEFYLMCVIPFAIILYLRIGAGNLMESMYGNVTGILVMSGCLLLYGGCCLYGKRLLEIKV